MRTITFAALMLLGALAQAKNWDRDAAVTEEGRIRSEYLSKAGTLPSYKYDAETGITASTGESYHGNCCGEGDAYEADDVLVDADGVTWAVLTCNHPDDCTEIQGKEVRTPGSRWKVPPEKVLLNYNPTNNTGHGWVYISPGAFPAVLCWAAPPGG